MVDWFGPRRPSWRVLLLDGADRPLRQLDVSGGSVELVALSRLGGSGVLELPDRGGAIDWMSHRVQVVYDPGIDGAEAWPLATMLLSSPVERRRAGRSVFEVTLLPKLAVLDEDTVGSAFSLAAGTPIIDAVVALIESSGESRIAVTPSTAVLGSSLVWAAGTPKLTIVNDLLTAAGYWSLWVDGGGLFRVEPYLLPSERPVAFEFAAGPQSIHQPDWSREQNLSSVPNRFVVVGTGSEDEPALVGVATNEDPLSPFSFQARGRWVTRVEEGAEGEDQAAFDRLAQRRLLDAMSPVAKLIVKHALLPLEQNAVVGFRGLGRERVLATVQRMGFAIRGRVVDAEWREV